MQKTLYLIRGLPGSGKTELAYRIADRCVAADDFRYNDRGEYIFDPKMNGTVHSQCLAQVARWMKEKDDCSPIAVHNTFSTREEAKPYFVLAKQHGWTVNVITTTNNFHNVHNVPEETIVGMAKRWQEFSGGEPC